MQALVKIQQGIGHRLSSRVGAVVKSLPAGEIGQVEAVQLI
ncbi:MAG: hypothetical protein RugAbin2_00576 [Rugosibacter sp.]|jgi:hypothetical protein|nr:hypothetical protein [Rugosibacter sp.]